MVQPLIYISRRQALAFAAFLVLYEFLSYIANDMIMPGMIKVVTSFNSPDTAVASSLTAYLLGGASLQIILGPISDHYGRRPIMISGAVFFFLCTLLIAASQSIDQFIVARFLQGMSLCFIGVVGYATLQEIFAEMDAVRLFAIMANVAILAPLLGPALGALIIYYFSWRWIFILVALFALLALVGLWRYMPESIGQITREGQKIKRGPPLSLRNMVTTYRKLLSNKRFISGSLALGLIGSPCLIWIALAPVLLIKNAQLSVLEYGLWQIPIFSANIMGNWFLHHLTYRSSIKRMIYQGSVVVMTSLALLCLLPLFFGFHYLWLMPGLILYFFGLGITCAPLDRYILFSTTTGKGIASAVISITSLGIEAIAIEIANLIYFNYPIYFLAIYIIFIALTYCIFVWCCFHFKPPVISKS